MLLAEGVTMLGPPGSFARNFWPVLVPLGLVASVPLMLLGMVVAGFTIHVRGLVGADLSRGLVRAQ